MNVDGVYSIDAPAEKVYAALLDPIILARCMPGCDELVSTGPGEYQMKMKIALAAFSGLFGGKVRITDENPPVSYRMVVEGSGKAGFLKGDGTITLVPGEHATTVEYKGHAQVGGTIAAVGQRLVDTTARMIIRKFFEKLAENVKAA